MSHPEDGHKHPHDEGETEKREPFELPHFATEPHPTGPLGIPGMERLPIDLTGSFKEEIEARAKEDKPPPDKKRDS